MRAFAKTAWSLLTATHRRFAADSGGLLAGSVAFFSSLSLIPLALFVISTFGHIIGSGHAYQQVTRMISQYFPGSSDLLLRALDSARATGGRWLVDLVAGVGLLWSGMNLFTALSVVLTIVFAGEPKRGFLARKAVSALAVIAAGIIFLASIVITSAAATLSTYASTVGAASAYMPYVELFNSAFSLLFQAVLAGSMFFLLYWLLPAGGVKPAPALAAAAPAALLWTASRWAFALLVAGSSHYGRLYGPLAGAVVLLLWIYYSAYILILCGEFGAVVQERWWSQAPARKPSSRPQGVPKLTRSPRGL